MKKNILVVAAFSVVVSLLQACNSGGSNAETSATASAQTDDHGSHGDGSTNHSAMMDKMMIDMDTVKMTGDFDVDFAKMMIPHHQGAVDMAQEYLSKGSDEKIKSIARNIIAAQKQEIEQLRTMVSDYKPTAKANDHSASGHAGGEHNELMESMTKMMEKMKGMKMTGDADTDFITMMIPHHQSAIDMAENEISHGKSVQMKQFAQKVIDDQSREIKEFEQWLSNKK